MMVQDVFVAHVCLLFVFPRIPVLKVKLESTTLPPFGTPPRAG